jgi:soluble lytic murein transglycosylase-like protein
MSLSARHRRLAGLALSAAVSVVLASAWAPPPAAAQPAVDPMADFVAEAARRFALPETWIAAVIRIESRGDSRAVSVKGAMGLMQVMPQTWSRLRRLHGLGADPFDPHDNIVAGAAFLREMFDRYGAPGFLAAYNAGPARYDAYLRLGRPLPAETRAYLAKLAPALGVEGTPLRVPDPQAWRRATVFASLPLPSASLAVGAPVSAAPHDVTGLEPRADSLFAGSAFTGRQP